jgi:hypothetical protein
MNARAHAPSTKLSTLHTKLSTFVILSEAGAHATAKSKDPEDEHRNQAASGNFCEGESCLRLYSLHKGIGFDQQGGKERHKCGAQPCGNAPG